MSTRELIEATRCVNTEWPLTHLSDATGRGLAMKATRLCDIEECDRPLLARGMCNTHYVRNRKHGNPHTVLPMGGPRPGSGRKRTDGPIGYLGAHGRVYTDRGRAAAHECTHCGGPAVNWAYDHKDPNEMAVEWGGRLVRYSIDPAHYMPLCKACHNQFDRRK